MSPDKAAAYDRNIAAAEAAMQNAVAAGDTDAYSRALYIYEWATKAREGVATSAQERVAPKGIRA